MVATCSWALRHWQAALDGLPPVSVPLGHSGPDVLARRLRSLEVSRAQRFWSNALEGLTAPTRPMLWRDGSSNDRLDVKATIDGEALSGLAMLADEAQASINDVVQAAWGLALSAYSGESKVSFGVTHSGRRGEAQPNELVGMFFKPEDQMRSVEQLEHWLTELRIDTISPPTALWHEWVSRMGDASMVPPALKLVVIGGEAASMAAFSRWQDSPYRKVRLLNAYGPTEATVSVTCFEPAVQEPDSVVWKLRHMPIGRPLEGMSARVTGATGG